MQFTAQEICLMLQGELDGNPAEVVNALSKIEEGKKGTLSFLSNPKYESFLYQTDASAVIVSKDLTLKKPVKTAVPGSSVFGRIFLKSCQKPRF